MTNPARVSHADRALPAHVPPRRRRDDGLAVAGVAPRLGRRAGGSRRRRRRFPSGSPRCSWATASTRTTGGPRAPAPRWSWARRLEPLAPLKTKLNVINGLFNKPATGVGIHPGQTGNILSGVPLQKGAELQGGISMDQVLANHIGQETVQPSMVLGCEQPITGYHETNFSMAYSSHISWQSADSPVPMEVYPSLAFDSLFENRGSRRNQSMLDRVKEQAASLQPAGQLQRQGQARRVPDQRPRGREARRAHARRPRTRPTSAPSDRGQPAAHDEAARQRPARRHPRAHAADVRHRRAGVPDRQDARRHAAAVPRPLRPVLSVPRRARRRTTRASHDDLSDGYERISRYYVSQLAYLADTLDAMPEGEGTVLDNSLPAVPVEHVVRQQARQHEAAGAHGRRPGRHARRPAASLDYLDKGDDNRKLCSLYLSIMDRMGVKLDRFGDADTRLAGL